MYSAKGMRRAVIDIGSNSVLLLIAESTESGWQPTEERSEVTGLGRGLKPNTPLDPASRAKTLEAIANFIQMAKEHSCQKIVAAGTMAVRIATDGSEFIQQVQNLGIEAQILSGADEARLSLKSVCDDPLFSNSQIITCIDPGGHSTEIAVATRTDGKEFQQVHGHSASIGALGLMQTAFTEERASFKHRLAATEQIDDAIGQRFLPKMAGTVVTVGATGTNLVSIREKLETWDPGFVHGQQLGYEEISKEVDRLSSMDTAERSQLVGIEPGRAATIHIGALILERCLFAVGAETCFVSTKGWRHALLD